MRGRLILSVDVVGLGLEAGAGDGAELVGRFGHGRYAYHEGLPNLIEAFARLGVRATFFWPAIEAERAPHLLDACLEAGHEIACHGHAFEDLAALSDAEAEEMLGRAFTMLARRTGRSIEGFRAPAGRLSASTLRIVSALGARYDSSFVDDDEPYAVSGLPLLEIPWSETLRDSTHFRHRLPPARVEALMMEELDAMLDERLSPCLTLTPRADLGMARLARLPILHRLIDRARERGADILPCRAVVEPPPGGAISRANIP